MNRLPAPAIHGQLRQQALAATPAHYTLVPTQEADDIDVDSSDVRPDLADEAETEWCSGASTALSVAVILLLLLLSALFLLLPLFVGTRDDMLSTLLQVWYDNQNDAANLGHHDDITCSMEPSDGMSDNAALATNRTRHSLWRTLFSADEEDMLRLRYNTTRSLPYCGVINGTERGQWNIQPDNGVHFNLHHCRLRRPTLCQAQHCLSNQSLLFMGDSLTRYMYAALLYFLTHNGHWPHPLGQQPNQPSPVVQPEHGTWAQYYQSSATTFAGKENCTCYRSGNGSIITERRHYYEAATDTTVRFFFYPFDHSLQIGLQEVAQEWAAWYNGSLGGSGSGGGRREQYTWTIHSNEPQLCSGLLYTHPSCYYPSFAPYRPAGVLIANVGIWQRSSTADPQYYSRIRAALPSGVPVRAIWKLTTPKNDSSETKLGANEIAARVFSNSSSSDGGAARWEMLDLFAMVNQTGARSAYWDLWHFRPYVYEEMSVFMLNMLCDELWNYVKPGR